MKFWKDRCENLPLRDSFLNLYALASKDGWVGMLGMGVVGF